MNEKPWLILTLRRTGGTSLTSFLSQISTFPSIEHEPFNVDRSLGGITRAFQADEDVPAMEAAIAEALEERPNIKHCVEIIPLELTRTLIDAALERGYHFMVLTRRDEARRLASLFLAQSTGAWGPTAAAKIYPKVISGELSPTPIELKHIQNRVRTDFYSIGRSLSLLRNRQINYDWLLFEELYFGDTSIEQQAVDIAARLGIDVAPDDDRLANFSSGGGQKSGDIASYVPNYDEAVAQLKKLCTE